MTLQQKGLVLVIVPLLFEVVFVSVLAALLFQSESDLKREARASNLASLTGRFSKLYYDTATAAIIYRATKSEMFAEQYEELSKEIPDLKIQLFAALKEDSALAKSINAIEDDVKDANKLLYEVRYVEPERGFDDLHSLHIKAQAVYKRLLDDCADVNSYAKLLGAASPTTSSQSRQHLVQALAVGIVVNLLLALILVIFFTRSVTRRLSILTENASRLKNREKLLPALSETDEIGTLDRVFHDMADALTEASRKERSLIENASDVLCSVNKEGCFTKVSQASEKVWGYQPEELVGKPLVDLILPQDKGLVLDRIKSIVASAGEGDLESSFVCKDLKVLQMRWAVHWSVADETLFCVAHDVTHEKELEWQKQQVMDTVAHDLRTPIASVQIVLNLLRQGAFGEQSEQAKTRIERAEGEAQRLIRLVNDLLDYDKLGSGKMGYRFEAVRLSEIIDLAVQSLAELARESNVQVVSSVDGSLVRADKDRLMQVLVNLLSNAIKFSPANGTVKIAAEQRRKYMAVAVSDQGVGVPVAHQKKIFERFQQADIEPPGSRQKGTGLGLPIARHIVEAHGGSIGVDSKEGEGASFWFTVPIAGE